MNKKILLLISVLMLAVNASAVIRYVTQNGAGTQDGSSWANASNDFQAIINASHWEGDTIFVAAGTYKPIRMANYYATDNITLNNRINAFVIVKSISIFGSFAGTETLPDERQLPASGDYTSILSGDFLGNDGPNFSGMGENAYHVLLMFENNTTRDLLIDGFTILGGNANGGTDPMLDVTIINNAFWFEHCYGGGVYFYYAVPLFRNVKITGNSALGGGGMYCKSSAWGSMVFNNVIISGNRTVGISGNPGSGGGVFAMTGNPVFNDVIISGNSSDYGGGIASATNTTGVYNNVIISGNTASIQGGGMSNSFAAPVLNNVIFSGNFSAGQGGGICNTRSTSWGGETVMTNVLFIGNTAATGGGMSNLNCSPILTNVTVAGNTANSGGGIYNYSYNETWFSAPEIRNSIIWGNNSDNVFNTDLSVPVYSNCLVGGEPLTGGIILNSDPLFDSNFNLQDGSPCINVGNNLFFATGQTPDLSHITTDLAGNPRFVGSNVDMGAFENQVVLSDNFSIFATAGTGGQIMPSGIINVVQGHSQTFTFTPDAANCYEIANVLVDNQPVTITGNSYTFENVTENHTIEVVFKKIPYTIIATAGLNGVINPAGAVTVSCGDDKTFTFAANTGYEIDNVLVDNQPVTVTGNSYTFENVTENHTIEVVFRALPPDYYTVFVTYGSGGTISPNGFVQVPSGGAKTFIITPKTGFKIDKVWVDDVYNQQAVDDRFYTFTNVTDNHTLTATFTYISLEQYYINASVNTTGGIISPSGKIMVTTGDDITFTITPQIGYQIKEVLVDGINNPVAVANGEYTFYDIECSHVIVAKFEKQTFVIDASVTTAGGTITPQGESVITYGGSKAYTITPQAGYLIDEVLINGIPNATAATSGKYTFSNVTDNHTIVASFKQRTWTITASAGAGGEINPYGVTTVLHGNSQTYFITPDVGYMIKQVLVNGKNVAASVVSGTYTFSTVTANQTIAATFVPTNSAPATTDEQQITVYPNPTNGMINVQCLMFNVQNIEIFDVMGRVVTVETWRAASLHETLNVKPENTTPPFGHPSNNGGEFTLDISNAPSGIYFVRIQTDNDVVIRKIIKSEL